MGNADNVLFDNDSRVAPLGLIAMAGASELGKNKHHHAFPLRWQTAQKKLQRIS